MRLGFDTRIVEEATASLLLRALKDSHPFHLGHQSALCTSLFLFLNVRPMNWFRHHSQVTTSNGKDSSNRWSRAGPDGWGPC
ncbi:hypothetical protein D5086_001085 [Populus alba]|uniref:Uncharacterized protein n=1 Tax=Populus alba TaxID=43335 RepID=A0ACC4CZ96_POPAL